MSTEGRTPTPPAAEHLAAERLRAPWSRSDRFVPRTVLRPLQDLLETSSASAVLLVGAAAIALVWANSPWADTYERLWATRVHLGIGSWSIDEDLRFWVNEGLMTFFFLLAGLEIKRELTTGELRERRAGTLPLACALAGMLVPALLFLAITRGTAASDGWAIVLPTDLAFALGILALAGRSAPGGLRPFLLTLAVADDVATIVVLVVFASASISAGPLFLAVGAVLAMLALERIHVRHLAPYLILGVAGWLATYAAGVHPALAGAVFGLLAPARPFHRPAHVSAAAHRIADETVDDPTPPDVDAPSWLELARLSREAVSPLARVEHTLLPWVTLLALPLFALANAGVRIGGGIQGHAAVVLVVGIVVARLLGKGLGITLLGAWLDRVGVARAPAGVGMRSFIGGGLAAGAPFAVSLFAAEVAFPEGSLLDAARLGILIALVACAGASLLVFRSQ